MVETWQLVLIAWGDKYPVAEINLIAQQVRAQAAIAPRVILLTDRDRPGLDADIATTRFPDFWLRPEFCTGGCQAKLAMFEKGVLPEDLPALYIDLDTMVMGDMRAVLEALSDPQAVAILQSAVLPFGGFARWLKRVTKGKRYARGNSSIVAFHPAQCHYIAAEFKRLEAEHGIAGFKPLRADERFISWIAQDHMQAVSNKIAVKFPTEFMWPWRWMAFGLQALPWVAARRAGLLAVTFPGLEVKFNELLALTDGAEVVDRKGRRLIWSRRALGPLKDRIVAYWGRVAEDSAAG
ncbi:hypothetical protein [Albirhodobacter sp. R86504]|uniref:hypothetical protein n=1 Tax=Albirhodobacter sp. R86504 TaxID=3093848 RepID=UPI00366F2E25